MVLLFAVSCKEETNKYSISGKLENVEGDNFYMLREFGDSIFVDTIPINNKGEFSFSGYVDTLTVMSLYFNENTKTTFLLVDKGWKVSMQGDVLYPDLLDIKGGDVNDDLTEFKDRNKDLLKSRTDILNAAEEDFSDTTEVKDYVVELKNINFELSEIAANYIKTHPNKISSVMLTNIFFKDESSIPRLEENLSLLKGRAADFVLTSELKTFASKVKMSAVGAHAPYFSLPNMKDKNVTLSEYRGKYLLLLFASTTCEVCYDEKDDAVEVYNTLKKEKKNIDFISIVKDIEQTPIPKNIADTIKWTILPVNGGWGAKPFENYYIREIPYNILISPHGTILERDIPIKALPKKLEELPNNTIDKNKK
ncbi:MAG: redoxin domain-containing protein [Dysgonomonas sp.]|nr:redoxin domain-containing protein [Dysgonomonas sp.]